jgi:hypothetical protein
MANLIYRGVAHDGHQPIHTRVARDLVYRGIRHDGLTAEPPTPSRTVAMRYRGAAYTRVAGTIRPHSGTGERASGQAVAGHAFA